MKQPRIREVSTDGRNAVLGLALVILAWVYFFYQDSIWQFLKSRWPIHDVIGAAIGSIFTLCVFVGISKSGFLKNVTSPIVVNLFSVGFLASLIATVICVVILADKFRPVGTLVEYVCGFGLLLVLGGIIKLGLLLLWLLMRYLVDHYRQKGDEWIKSMQSWRKPHVEVFSLLLWGILGLGVLWGIRACSKAIIQPDRHPPAYYDPSRLNGGRPRLPGGRTIFPALGDPVILFERQS
jgi:hypothetical protein